MKICNVCKSEDVVNSCPECMVDMCPEHDEYAAHSTRCSFYKAFFEEAPVRGIDY